MSLERLLAGGAYVANLRVADGAHDKVLLDGGTAIGAVAVLGKLTLAKSHLELLLLAIGGVHAGTHDQVGDQTDKRNEASRPHAQNA